MKQDSKVKKTAFHFIFGRTVIVAILLLLQIGLLLFLMQAIGEATMYLTVVISAILLVVVINGKGQPAFKMAWILPLTLLPVFGGLLYLFVQLQPGTRKIQEKLTALQEETRPYLKQNPAVVQNLLSENPQMAQLSHYLSDKGSYPIYQNSSVEYFPDGETYYAEMIRQLEQAKNFIFMEYFIVAEGRMWESVLEILRKKAAEGVEVRFMYDGMCSLLLLPYKYPERIREMGIQCKMFAPIRPALSSSQNNRDHRKVLVIDGITALYRGRESGG